MRGWRWCLVCGKSGTLVAVALVTSGRRGVQCRHCGLTWDEDALWTLSEAWGYGPIGRRRAVAEAALAR